MFNIFKNKNKESTGNDKKMTLVCSLFIHAAKMDEKYTDKEKNIILKAMLELYPASQDKFNEILSEAEEIEKKSNQILEFTREIKNYDKSFRLKVIENLWKIIYSDEISDMYESNLMRRLSKLLYVSDKEIGDLKMKINKNFVNWPI